MARDIAQGEISISVDLERIGAELRAAEAQVMRSMQNIDRMEAEADVSIDKKRLRRDIADIKSELRALEAMDIDPDVRLDDKAKAKLKKDIAECKAMLKELDAEKIKVDVDSKELDELAAAERRHIAQQEKAQRAVDRRYAKEGQLYVVAKRRADEEARARTKAFEQEGKLFVLAQQRESQYLREANAQRRKFEQEMAAEGKLHTLAQKRAVDDRKRAVELEKLRLQYIKLHDEIERGSKSKMFGFLGDETARTRFAQTEAELKRVRDRIIAVGGRDTDFVKLEHASDSAGNRLRRMASSLGSVRLQMGFLSATLRQTAIGFVALGPVIFGLLGQISALVGVLGTGLTGALAVSAAGIAGFGLSALGIGLIMKPLIGDLQDAMKASKAYGDAVRKYGKESTQAETAQEKLNKTLGDVGPNTRAAFQSLSGMSDRWSKLTRSARPMFFETMASGIRAANRLMPTFAQESVRAFDTAGRETQKWFDMFSSPEATAGISRLMSGFTASLPALSAGFRSIFAGLSRVSVSASNLLPMLTTGFSQWATNLEKSIGSGAGLDAKITRLVTHMQEVGHFAQASGRMLAAFFNAGANEGASLLNTLTNIFNRWTAWMNSAQGQSGLAEFFSQANAIGSQFVGTLAQIGIALFEFSQAFAPLSTGFIAVVNGISSVVSALMGLSAARAVVTSIGGALAGAFAVGKIMAAVTAVQALVTAIRGIGLAAAASSVVALTNPLIALGALAGGAAALFMSLSGGADAAASSMDRLSAATQTAQGSMNSLAGIEASMASAGVQLTAARAGQARAQLAYNTAVSKFGENSKQARDAEMSLSQAMVTADQARQQANRTHNQYRNNVNKTNVALGDQYNAQKKAVEELRKKVAEEAKYPTRAKQHAEAVRDLKTAEESLQQIQQKAIQYNQRVAQTELNAARAQSGRARIIDNIGSAWKRVRDILPDAAEKPIIKAVDPKDAAQAIRLSDSLMQMGRGAAARKVLLNTDSIDDAISKLRKLQQDTAKQKKVNVKADADTSAADRKLNNLDRRGKGREVNINTKADTKKAEADINKVSRKKGQAKVNVTADASAANAAINRISGRKIAPKRVTITANADNAATAISKVSSAKIPAKKFNVTADISAADAANRKVQSFKDKTVRVLTQADTSGASAAQSAINSIPSNTNKYITIIERKVKASAQGSSPSDQPVPNATRSAGPRVSAADKRNVGTAAQANFRARRPGIYKRPTLLVGEERQDEYVIATNPAYRAANEGYLEDAAARFGYQLTPIETANRGKKPQKGRKDAPKKLPTPSKVGQGVNKYIRNAQQRYTYLRGEISRLTSQSSDEQAAQDLLIRAGKKDTYTYPPITTPLTSALGVYGQLKKQIQSMIGGSQKSANKSRAVDRSINRKTLAADRKAIQAARKRERSLKRNEPGDKASKSDKQAWRKKMSAAEKATKQAEDKFSRNKQREQDAKANVKNQQQSVGDLWRELNQQIPSEVAGIQRQLDELKYMREGLIPGPEGGGGSSVPFGVQLGALDKARYEAFQQFAGNVGPGAVYSSPGPGPLGGGGPAGVGGPSFYQSKAGPGGGAAGVSAVSGGSGGASQGGVAVNNGTTVNQTINMQKPPPDPHSFSKQLGWEAAALLG